MRVLFVNENIGGHATVHLHLRHALAAHPDVEPVFLDVPRATLSRRLVGARVPGLARLDLDLAPLRAQLALSAWVRKRVRAHLGRVDVVHVYTQNAGLLSAPLLRQVPTVVSTDATNATNAFRLTYRYPTIFTPATLRLTQPFERQVYRSATLVVANSDWIAGSLREDYGVPANHLRVQPAGITAPPEAEVSAAPAPPAGRLPRLVFVGRSLQRKGALRLIHLHQQYLADRCELLLVTPEPVPPGRNVRVIDDVRLGDARLWQLLRSATVFVFPSQLDHAPNAVLEAMAAGVPVLGIWAGAVPEMLDQGRAGRLVAPDDEDALVAALSELLDNPALRAHLAAQGRRRFQERYDAAVTTPRLLDVLREARELHAAGDPVHP